MTPLWCHNHIIIIIPSAGGVHVEFSNDKQHERNIWVWLLINECFNEKQNICKCCFISHLFSCGEREIVSILHRQAFSVCSFLVVTIKSNYIFYHPSAIWYCINYFRRQFEQYACVSYGNFCPLPYLRDIARWKAIS